MVGECAAELAGLNTVVNVAERFEQIPFAFEDGSDMTRQPLRFTEQMFGWAGARARRVIAPVDMFDVRVRLGQPLGVRPELDDTRLTEKRELIATDQRHRRRVHASETAKRTKFGDTKRPRRFRVSHQQILPQHYRPVQSDPRIGQ